MWSEMLSYKMRRTRMFRQRLRHRARCRLKFTGPGHLTRKVAKARSDALGMRNVVPTSPSARVKV